MNKQAFQNAILSVTKQGRQNAGIGTLSEKTLHAVLKQYFEPHIDNQETKVGRYVADIVGENGIIEIQTQGFNRLRAKLSEFLECTRVTVVYPIAETKWLCWIDKETGDITKKRKSPKKGTVHDAFFELYKIKQLLNHPNLSFCFMLLEIEEYRYLDGWSKDKKKGSSRYDRIPVDIIDEVYINSFDDYVKLISGTLPTPFTTKDYAKMTGLSISSAQKALNVLLYVNAVKRTGKSGRLYLYELNFK